MPESAALQRLRDAARDPRAYVAQWRAHHPGCFVVGVMPMNFPREIALAAGVLPVYVQDDQRPVAEGRAYLPEFYCGYTRNLADQAATGRLDHFDALLLADHCIQLLGASDVARAIGDRPVFFGMLISSLSDSWAEKKIAEMMGHFRAEFEKLSGAPVEDEALALAIEAYNADRQLLRRVFDERAAGDTTWSPVELQDMVVSAQVMDPVEHHDLLVEALAAAPRGERDDRVRVHLSGHLCHAPRRELLEVIEETGAVVVDDDLWSGRRYVQSLVPFTPGEDPMSAIGRWYAERNVDLPCPTRVQHDVDWDAWLIDATRRSGAEVVVHLMPKFCEPHMLFYPELRKALDAAGIPQLLVETEHEGIPLEALRTRLEALVERAVRHRPAYA
ncbi:2-hydroxyacyl-CoA dehydratase family protein [Pseudonocardia sp. RS11V-5]|uniref:2-hydroxyacyl-CoA dehydratase subunit D n=1 Tax=Pseudonocardia terrae TaxID=2905831 RepID=UPI001E4C6168|nr:2-hydroxyacyl-CoA dehydratase family protein [Pseudonocardia terrae]MCE3551190.1 2-hydroxyacyl-CoA dehydratase family protein [Pseudonocardia terrae]